MGWVVIEERYSMIGKKQESAGCCISLMTKRRSIVSSEKKRGRDERYC